MPDRVLFVLAGNASSDPPPDMDPQKGTFFMLKSIIFKLKKLIKGINKVT